MKRSSNIIFFFLIIFIVPCPSILSISQESSPIKISQSNQRKIVGFSRNNLLSTNDNSYAHHVEVSMVITDNGDIFVGWKNAETHYGGGARVSIVRSEDNGQTWSSPYNMPTYSGLNTRQSDPWLFWYNSCLYYAYLEHDYRYFDDPAAGYLSQITVAKSIDYGHSWIPVKATNATYFADKETFVVRENNTVYLVYDDVNVENENGTATVRLSRSIDGGDSYQEISVLGEDIYYIGPYITLNSSGDLHVAWSWIPEEGGNIFYSRSIDGGYTFETPKPINFDGNFTGIGTGKSSLPLTKFDHNNRLYIVWADKFNGNWDVWLRYSDTYGDDWSNRILINPSVSGNQWNPDMVIDSNNTLHFVYYSESGGVYRPYYRTLNFTGENREFAIFSDQVVIADRDTSSNFVRPGEYFAIQLDQSGIPHVAWTDGRDNELDIYYAYGLTVLPLFTPEVITAIIVTSIVAIASIIYVFYKRHQKGIPIIEKELKEKRKKYMEIYDYFCNNCKKFSTTLQYCEHCGAKGTLRFAKKEDFKKYIKSKED